MPYPDHGVRIAEAFQEYLKTGDESLIDDFSAKELKLAVSQLSPYYDHNKKWYRELERHIEKLESHEERERGRQGSFVQVFRQKWLDKTLAFALGFLGGVVFC